MEPIEYAIDVWDLTGTDGRPDAEQLLEHLRDFGDQGWELVWVRFNVELVRHGPSHLLVFKRAGPAKGVSPPAGPQAGSRCAGEGA
jgi:hypothetical protein